MSENVEDRYAGKVRIRLVARSRWTGMVDQLIENEVDREVEWLMDSDSQQDVDPIEARLADADTEDVSTAVWAAIDYARLRNDVHRTCVDRFEEWFNDEAGYVGDGRVTFLHDEGTSDTPTAWVDGKFVHAWFAMSAMQDNHERLKAALDYSSRVLEEILGQSPADWDADELECLLTTVFGAGGMDAALYGVYEDSSEITHDAIDWGTLRKTLDDLGAAKLEKYYANHPLGRDAPVTHPPCPLTLDLFEWARAA